MTFEKFEKEYEEFWKPLLMTNGEYDGGKIKNELYDLVFIYQQISKVYDNITGGKLSKPMYYADIIINEYNEQIQQAYNDGYNEGCSDTGIACLGNGER